MANGVLREGPRGKGERERGGKGERENEKKKKGDLSRWAARNGAQARDQKNGLFERREAARVSIFPRAGAEFRPSGSSLDLLVLLDQAKRTYKRDHATTPESITTPPKAQTNPSEHCALFPSTKWEIHSEFFGGISAADTSS